MGAESGKMQVAVGPASWGRMLPVYYALPPDAGPGAPVLMVLHGIGRDAREYLDIWEPLGRRLGYVIVVPEFSVPPFDRTRGYQLGNLFRRDGSRRNPARTAFAALEQVFDAVRQRFRLEAVRYDLFGHSAGAQFVHRLVLFWPEARYHIAIAANAGTYTAPDPHVPLRYGIADAGLSDADLRRALGARLVVMAGARDTSREHYALNRSAGAMSQGPHRRARAGYFMAAGEAAARRLGVPLAWRYVEVPGVDHEPAAMATAAARVLEEHSRLAGGS